MKTIIFATVFATWSPYYIDTTGVYKIVEAQYQNDKRVLFWKVDTLEENIHEGTSLMIDDNTWTHSQNDTTEKK